MNYLPNILTIIRLILAPIFFILLISKETNLVIVSYFIYVFGAITDYLDGLIARKYNIITPFGSFFDPLADKFLTSFAFLAFANLGILNIWLVAIVVFRDIFTTIMRIYRFDSKSGLITSKTAKWKTFFQMIFIFYILTIIFIYYSEIIHISIANYHKLLYSIYIDLSMVFITILSIWTMLDYGVSTLVSIKSSKKKDNITSKKN